MPAEDKYSYPPAAERTYIGRRMGRVDGTAKSTGHAKYTYDYNPKGVLYGAFVRSPHAHARITNIDTSEAGEDDRRKGCGDSSEARQRDPLGWRRDRSHRSG